MNIEKCSLGKLAPLNLKCALCNLKSSRFATNIGLAFRAGCGRMWADVMTPEHIVAVIDYGSQYTQLIVRRV
ncbi:MAG: hypothetical protein IJ985_05980, partial [Akkermansia sp.]|nr:hypothetical protein [Akkermansia sp.]